MTPRSEALYDHLTNSCHELGLELSTGISALPSSKYTASQKVLDAEQKTIKKPHSRG